MEFFLSPLLSCFISCTVSSKGVLNGSLCVYFGDNGLLGGLPWLVQKHGHFVGVQYYWYQCDNNFGQLSHNEIQIAVWCGQNCGEWQCLRKQTELSVRVKKSQQQLCALLLSKTLSETSNMSGAYSFVIKCPAITALGVNTCSVQILGETAKGSSMAYLGNFLSSLSEQVYYIIFKNRMFHCRYL